MAECKVYSVKVEPILDEYLDSGKLELLQKIVRESDNSYYVSRAIDKLKNYYEMGDCLDGINAWRVAAEMRKRLNVSVYDYVLKFNLAAKLLPHLQKTDPGIFAMEKRVMLGEFYKRKFGHEFNLGPQLDLYDLEMQVNDRDLDKAYNNVTLDDLDRLYDYLRRIDDSDEFSYGSSQGNMGEYHFIEREYLQWSNEKLSNMDLLTDADRRDL